MKREVIVFVFLFSLIFILPLVIADEQAQVDKAYTCLETKINSTKCSSLAFEERVFSLLATGMCEKEIISDNSSNQCWPKSGCKLKSTAQAVLALNGKANITKAETWLLSQTSTPTDIDWFLEIESSSATSCTVVYSDTPYTLTIGDNKKISSSNLGTCLSLAQDSYWLKISSTCYNKDITVSCDKGFITTLLFRKKNSQAVVHVSENVHSASASIKTTEKVDALCFAEAGVCNYEGSLWAARVLYFLNNDVSKFMPYLITSMDNNSKYLPESFLYYLTGQFEVELLSKQIAGLYWEKSGDKYYDTALALWPLYYDSPYEKQSSKEWLLRVQESGGCWNGGNTRDTAFILYSIWPKGSPPGPGPECLTSSYCPSISCKESFCDEGVCSYDWFGCESGDGCCNPGCTYSTDHDCLEDTVQCTSDTQCEDYNYDSEFYCSDDNTKIYKDVFEYTCENHVCAEEKTTETIETCSSDKECDAGYCVDKGIIPPGPCETWRDCAEGEDCNENGECIPVIYYDCQESGNFCMSSIDCEGNLLGEDYTCAGTFKCCNTPKTVGTCSSQGGTICNSEQFCPLDGTVVPASDAAIGEICCAGAACESGTNVCEIDSDCSPGETCSGGNCIPEIIVSSCTDNKGVCRSECKSKEEENSNYNCDSGVCCVASGGGGGKGWILIIILLILVVFAGLGIVFRDKLRVQWMKLKDKFGGKKQKSKFEMPLTHVGHIGPPPSHRILPHRIFPPSAGPHVSHPIRRPMPGNKPSIKKPEEKPKGELEDVIKKLKEMGK
jgi:hypothetical protein